MIHELDGGQYQAALLNFAAHPIAADVTSRFLAPGAAITDVSTGRPSGAPAAGIRSRSFSKP
jgi:hypothetical protein